MGFRYRKRWNLLPGLAINFSKKGLSSLSIGRPGATINVPIAREGPAQGTVGLPGTGLSWRESLSDKSQSKRDRQQEQRGENGYTSTERIITDLSALRHIRFISRVKCAASLGDRITSSLSSLVWAAGCARFMDHSLPGSMVLKPTGISRMTD